jgi:hypothetical protein
MTDIKDRIARWHQSGICDCANFVDELERLTSKPAQETERVLMVRTYKGDQWRESAYSNIDDARSNGIEFQNEYAYFVRVDE